MKILSDESGQSLIFAAISLTFLLGFVGLAADVSMMMHDKRIVQTAADTAALAAATEYLYVSTTASDVKTAGQNATIADGITTGSDGATVTINDPPLYGPHALTAGYVEAIVSLNQTTAFSATFGALLKLSSPTAMTATARAVAWTGAQSNSCFDVLDPTAAPAAELQGSYTVGVPGCGMIIDSSSTNDALEIKGNGGSLTAGYIGVVGGISGNLPGGQTAQTGIVPVSDPLAGTLPAYSCISSPCTEVFPNGTTSAGPSCVAAPTASGSTWGLNQVGGAVCYTNTSIPSNITMEPGTYIFTSSSGVSLGGNANITADTGITFYFTTGSLNMVGTPNITITAPSSGPFDGVAYVQAPAITSYPTPVGKKPGGTPADTSIMYINGDSSGLFNGIVYAPDAEMEISGNTTINLPELIVGTFYDKGNATINITKTLPVGANPIKAVTLVE